MQQAQKKTFPGSGKFDPINSTYTHTIFFTNGKSIKGYSKGLLQTEMHDKKVLIQKIIVRLFNKGYLDVNRVDRIDFFLKSFLDNNDELILSLSPSNYVVHEKFLFDEQINSFLKKLYDQIKQGNIITKDITDKRKIITQEDSLSLQSKIYKTEDELTEACIKKVKNGIAYGAVRQFHAKYKAKFLSN